MKMEIPIQQIDVDADIENKVKDFTAA